MSDATWIDDLLKEKSLWQVHSAARQFKAKPFDRYLRIVSWIGIPPLTAILFGCVLSPPQQLSMLHNLSSVLVGFCTTVLGFLIAGLAIFTTLSEKKLWVALAKTSMEDEGVSAFKYMFFNILSVFLIFLAGVIIGAFFSVAASVGLKISNFAFGHYELLSASWMNAGAFLILVLSFEEALLRLKSFIWNLYSTFISMLTIVELVESEQ